MNIFLQSTKKKELNKNQIKKRFKDFLEFTEWYYSFGGMPLSETQIENTIVKFNPK